MNVLVFLATTNLKVFILSQNFPPQFPNLHAWSLAAWQMIVHGRFSAPAWQTSSLPGVTRDLISFFESIFVNLYPFYQLLHFYQL